MRVPARASGCLVTGIENRSCFRKEFISSCLSLGSNTKRQGKKGDRGKIYKANAFFAPSICRLGTFAEVLAFEKYLRWFL